MESFVVIVVLVVVSWAAWKASQRRGQARRAHRESALQKFLEDAGDRPPGPPDRSDPPGPGGSRTADPSGEGTGGTGTPPAGPRSVGADGAFFDAAGTGAPGGGPWTAGAGAGTPGGGAGAPGGGAATAERPQVVGGPDPGGAADGGGGFEVRRAADLPTFADVGGMDEFKDELAETFGLVLEHADRAAEYGITWNGILLHGRPGVGKTFLAQALAGEFACNLVHVSTGDLVSSFAGESARNVEAAFSRAEANRPCVLLFDEFDSVAQRRDRLASSEERRTVNQLLTSLEEHRGWHDLVVVATTNDVSNLDPAVVRPGRFDRHIRIDLPDRAARRQVLVTTLEDRPVASGSTSTSSRGAPRA